MHQALIINRAHWLFRVDLERGALGQVARDRIAGPDLPKAFAFGGLADSGARMRGEPLPTICLVEGRGWVLTIATSPTTTRVQLEVEVAWIEAHGGLPTAEPSSSTLGTRIWRHITGRLHVARDLNGTPHGTWSRLQALEWGAESEAQTEPLETAA